MIPWLKIIISDWNCNLLLQRKVNIASYICCLIPILSDWSFVSYPMSGSVRSVGCFVLGKKTKLIIFGFKKNCFPLELQRFHHCTGSLQWINGTWSSNGGKSMVSQLWRGPRSFLHRVGETVFVSGHLLFSAGLWVQMATLVFYVPCFFRINPNI